jgi:hypothetical protein
MSVSEIWLAPFKLALELILAFQGIEQRNFNRGKRSLSDKVLYRHFARDLSRIVGRHLEYFSMTILDFFFPQKWSVNLDTCRSDWQSSIGLSTIPANSDHWVRLTGRPREHQGEIIQYNPLYRLMISFPLVRLEIIYRIQRLSGSDRVFPHVTRFSTHDSHWTATRLSHFISKVCLYPVCSWLFSVSTFLIGRNTLIRFSILPHGIGLCLTIKIVK